MKLKLFISLTILSFFCNTMNAQSNSELAITDQDQLIKLCLEFTPLQDKIPNEIKALATENYIYGNGRDFNFSSNLKVNEKKVSVLSKSTLSPSKPYFDFFTFNIEASKALARIYFVYSKDGVQTSIPVTIELEKNGSSWQVTNHYFNF
jgi:hypothetical protein